MQCLASTLLEAYRFCLAHNREFALWIGGEKFTGMPKKAFAAILRLLDTPMEPPRRMLGLIDEGTIRIHSSQAHRNAAMSDGRC
jgi:hypothetical protein